jgi:serine/threonine-protein kinase
VDIGILNEILSFIESPYVVDAPIVVSGQRKVYAAKKSGSNDRFVLKVCPLQPVMVARIKREIKILADIDSKYFPKVYFEFFVTDEIIGYFIDTFDPKTQQARIDEIKKANIRPFLVTVEEHIEHLAWKDCLPTLRDEKSLIAFLLCLFEGLRLLWDKKIVHRDLKPDNILIRPNFEPVIIDLGIAKSMSDGATNITHPAFPSPCTPQFAAPEQLTNNKTEVTYKTDQFAVGIILFVLLTDKFPFGSVEHDGIENIVQNFFSGRIEDFRNHNTSASDGLVEFIRKLLNVQPYRRFRTGEEISDALGKIGEAL